MLERKCYFEKLKLSLEFVWNLKLIIANLS